MAWAKTKHESQIIRTLQMQSPGEDSSVTLRALQGDDERIEELNQKCNTTRSLTYLPRFGFVQSSKVASSYLSYLERRAEQEQDEKKP